MESDTHFFDVPRPVVQPQLSSAGSRDFVYHVTLLLLAFIAFLVLLRLPRALARFWRASEWLTGHFIWHVSYRQSRSRPSKRSAPNDYPFSANYTNSGNDASTDGSHTLYSDTKPGGRTGDNGAPRRVSFPPHVATCPRFVLPLVTLLRIRTPSGFSISQVLVLTLYFSVLLYAGLYKSSPFTDPLRTGWVAAAQLPFAFAFATKNNILGMLLGFAYERLNFLHRFAGRLVILAVNIHSIGYFYKWSLAGIFIQQMKTPDAIWGLVALIACDVIAFFSTDFWRRKAYNIFIASHILGISLLLPATWLHKSSMQPYIVACLGLYGLDYLLRIFKTRVCTAVIRPLPELDTTRIEVHHLNAGWRAGQHVRLRVLSLRLGSWGWTEVHPFTIASVSGGQEGLVLLAKKSGTWTTRLYNMAKASGCTEDGFSRDVKIMIEGPYGGPGHAIFESYSAAVFVVAGSGITFALSAVQDLIQKDLKGRSRVKIIELIWIVQDPASIHPLFPLFASMIQQSVYTPIHISLHYTRSALSSKLRASAQPGLTLFFGRPQIPKVLDAAINRAVSLGAGAKDSQRITGMLVAVCGPAALGDDVSKAVRMVEPRRRDQVGGIEIHEETFGL